MRVEELMNKPRATCGPDETLSEAGRKMQNSNCAYLPVTAGEESQYLLGVITDGDIRMAAELGGRSLEELRVRDAMAKRVRVCNPGDSLAEADATMQEADIHCLPIVDGLGRLLGMLSMADVARETVRDGRRLRARMGGAHFSRVASCIEQARQAGKPT